MQSPFAFSARDARSGRRKTWGNRRIGCRAGHGTSSAGTLGQHAHDKAQPHREGAEAPCPFSTLLVDHGGKVGPDDCKGADELENEDAETMVVGESSGCQECHRP
jgi:ribosomal protein L15